MVRRLTSARGCPWQKAVVEGLSGHVRCRTSTGTDTVHSQCGSILGRRDITMTTFRSRSADAAEIFALEHRFPLAATLFAMFVTGNIGSAVMMLLAQG
ncbi:MAG: hypothetical protein ACJ8DL_05820 [Microvirga sp.]